MADDDTRFAGVKRLGVDELVWQHLPAGLQQGLGRPQPRHGAQLHAAANLGRDVREPVLSQFLQVSGGRSLSSRAAGGAGLVVRVVFLVWWLTWESLQTGCLEALDRLMMFRR